MKICRMPFEQLEIHADGETYSCCPAYDNYYSLGNINTNDIENIWNSEASIEKRTRILNSDYSSCNLKVCPKMTFEATNVEYDPSIHKPKMDIYPKRVFLGHDVQCNIFCKICRDKIITNSPEEIIEKNNMIPTKYLPLMKDAEIVQISALGDPFSSPHSIKLMQEIVKNYPNIKFHIVTNGILCNKELLNEIGLTDKISEIQVSMHSVKEETYKKIVRGGDYKAVLNNIKMLSKMKEAKLVRDLYLAFVVTSLNYKEMIEFIEFARENNATPMFWGYHKSDSVMADNYDEYAVFEPDHKEHNQLLEILKHEYFRDPDIIYQFGFKSLVDKAQNTTCI